MPYLEVRGRLHRLPLGSHILGRGAGCDIQLDDAERGPAAHVHVDPDRVTLRPAGGAAVLVNGARVASGGRTLAHGDRIRIGRTECLYIDERQVGGTATAEGALAVGADATTGSEPAVGYADAGGTLARRDGTRVAVRAPRFRIGREAGCDLVLPQPSVSRLHAEIRYEGGKYVLYDLSTNGTFVNGRRMGRRRVLRAGDKLLVGDEPLEFACETVPLTPAEWARRQAEAAAAMPTPTARVRRGRHRRAAPFWLVALAVGALAAAWLFLL